MFASITAAITALFSTLITLFTATNKIAKSLDNLATVAEESSGEYADESRDARRHNRLLRNKVREAELAPPTNDII